MQFTPSRAKIRSDGFRRSAHATGELEAAPPSRLLAGILKGPDLGNWGVSNKGRPALDTSMGEYIRLRDHRTRLRIRR
jgi:hypothetical protein